LERGTGVLEYFRFISDSELSLPTGLPGGGPETGALLPLVTVHGGTVAPVYDRSIVRKDDVVVFASLGPRSAALPPDLAAEQWTRAEAPVSLG
jgi:hypothetical protein